MIYAVMKDFAGPVATILAALVAVGVTWVFARRQWKTEREKLLLDLFDKRFAATHQNTEPAKGLVAWWFI
jgi:hypothetical protein